MPHYSDLYSLPSASGLCMPHYNSGLNFLSYSKAVPRYSHLYKPHLSTISEISLPYRRLNAPKHYPSDITSRSIKTINTADIDVSVNKYKKFEKKGQQRQKAKEAQSYTPEKPVVVKEAKPNPGIRRDRATVRLKTLHTDTLKEEIGNYRKWRDNFEPEELNKDTKIQKKTKGELLKEKFLIRSRSKENIQALALENNKKNLIKKTSSFREICDAITCDTIDDELNPGQPEEIQRRQSKHQLSSDNLINNIRRVSAELTPEDLKVLNVMLASQNSSVDSSDESFTLYEVEEISKAQDNILPVEIVSELNKSETLQPFSSENANYKVSKQFSKPVKSNIRDTLAKEDVKQAENNPVQPKTLITNVIKEQEGKTNNKGNNVTKDNNLNKFNKKFIASPPVEAKSNENKAKIDTLRKQIEISKLKQKTNLQPNKVNTNVPENKEKYINNKLISLKPAAKELDVPRDISNVEIEQIKFKPKAVITASETSFDDTVAPKKTLIAVVDEIDVEKPNIKKDKRLRFNVSVNIEQVKKKEGSKNKAISRSIKRGTAFHPIPQKTLLNNLIIHKPKKYEHKELNELKLKKKNKLKEIIPDKTNIDQQTCLELTKKEEKIEEQAQNKLELDKLTKDLDNKLEEESKAETSEKAAKEIEIKPATKVCNLRASLISKMPPKLTSKRSLIQKSVKEDPDLKVFIPPPTPKPEPELEKKDENVFVPLQSNRLSQWMHPWAKPEQYEECPVEIFARPKVIRARHYPRGRKRNAPVLVQPISNSVEDESDSDDSEDTEETSASLRSTDSGFGSTIPEKLNANADNLQADAESESVDQEVEDFLTAVKKCGGIIPPATTIPRFKKYNVDDFDFMKVLGKGSFGKVLLAKLKETEYYYAVKCLKKDAIVEDDDVECTLIERKVLALGTKHPFLCHLLCTFQTESHLFFVMEYLNGGDLMFHITTTGCFPEDQARFYSAEVISGLQFLHSKGIIYRDLKLDNIILDFDGHVRLADFGMCKLEIFLDRMAESFCGTPDYMAPEIIKGQHYNQAVDWWSFGVLLYEMLLGQSPFSGCDEDELFWSICNEKPVFPKHLSTYSVDILKLLMEKDQAKRLGNRFCEHGPIREHSFYRSIDWADLEARRIEPPFKPHLVHPLDTQYFDTHFTKEAVKLTATEGPVLVTIDQSQFQGFSYTNPNACDK